MSNLDILIVLIFLTGLGVGAYLSHQVRKNGWIVTGFIVLAAILLTLIT